jgi:putative PIN family toxin of toxin-antitoxin system
MKKVVLDTNVLVAALRSRHGASFKLLSLVDTGQFEVVVSVPLVLEYEYALTMTADEIGIPPSVVSDILDYLCSVSQHQDIFYLWRPMLRDPRDDMILEVGVASSADAIITYNKRDFERATNFDIEICSAFEFLQAEGLL